MLLKATPLTLHIIVWLIVDVKNNNNLSDFLKRDYMKKSCSTLWGLWKAFAIGQNSSSEWVSYS